MTSNGKIPNPLFREKNFVNGKWVPAASGKTFEVTNPATDDVIGHAPESQEEDAENAIQAASACFKQWGTLPGKQRGSLLRNLFQLFTAHTEDLTRIVTLESGKSLAEAKAEISFAAAYLEWNSEEANRVHGEVVSSPSSDRELVVIKEPIGVVGLITPWNFPLGMLVRKSSAVLAAGCTCVVRPAEDTPYSALAMAALVEKAGFPPGTFNVVTSSREQAGAIGQVFCSSPLVAGISFTGSTVVGKILYKQCADTVKRISLELGGNSAFIVFPSANLGEALSGLMATKFRNSGQTCLASNRIFVHESIYEKFAEMVVKATESQIVLGNGLEANVTHGPLINDRQLQKVDGLVRDALAKGAGLLCGGGVHPTLKGRFYQPTVLANLQPNMEIYHEEIFGPVIALHKFSTEDEVVAISNSTRRGLANYFYSNDYAQVWRVAKRLESGMIAVNDGVIRYPEAPFGGIKESGFGREGSRHGMDEFLYMKFICFGGIKSS